MLKQMIAAMEAAGLVVKVARVRGPMFRCSALRSPVGNRIFPLAIGYASTEDESVRQAYDEARGCWPDLFAPEANRSGFSKRAV